MEFAFWGTTFREAPVKIIAANAFLLMCSLIVLILILWKEAFRDPPEKIHQGPPWYYKIRRQYYKLKDELKNGPEM